MVEWYVMEWREHPGHGTYHGQVITLQDALTEMVVTLKRERNSHGSLSKWSCRC